MIWPHCAGLIWPRPGSVNFYREFFVGLTRAVQFVISVLLERPNAGAREWLRDLNLAMTQFRGSARERQKIHFVMALVVGLAVDDVTSDDVVVYLSGEVRRMRESGFFVFGPCYEDWNARSCDRVPIGPPDLGPWPVLGR